MRYNLAKSYSGGFLMKTEIIDVFSGKDGREKALELTERTAAYCGLGKKESLHLRLLSEEIVELIRPFTGMFPGDFWLETNDKNIEIHLKTEIPMDQQTKKELLSVSTSGKNSAAKGLIGRIREMIATVTLPSDPETKMLTDEAMSLMSMGSPMGTYYSGAYSWSMKTYAASVNANSSDKEEAKDELEKSIVANIADEVSVNIVDSTVEVVIFKAV